MTPTQEYVQEQFNHYNALIFEGKLPPVRIVMSRGQRYLGKLEYRTVNAMFGMVRKHDSFLMRISCAKEMTQDEWDDVIIHEMIHYYIAFFNIKDRSAHGPVFRSMMQDINTRFGRHIVISHKLTEPDTRVRKHIVCVSVMPGGEYGISVFNAATPAVKGSRRQLTMAEKCIPALPRFYNVREMRIYSTENIFFNRFPHSRSPKIYKVNEEELFSALEGASELVFNGRFLSEA